MTRPSSLKRAAFWPLAAILLWLAVIAGSNGLSTALQRRGLVGPAIALGGNPFAYASIAERMQAARQDPAAVADMAAQAIRVSPMSVKPLRVYALAEKQRGDAAAYRRSIMLAGLAGWRDRPTQLDIVMTTLQSGEYRVALDRAEALIRLDFQRPAMFQVLRLLAEEPTIETMLTKRLAADPDWRAAFFNADGDIPIEQVRAMARLLVDLAASKSPVRQSETRSAIAMLVNRGDLPEAWRLYTRVLPHHRRAGLLSDSGFDLADIRYRPGDTATAFDWTLLEGESGSASVDRSSDLRRNPALFAQVDGNGAQTVLAEQSAPVAPGRYALAFKVRGDTPQARSFAHWTIECGRDAREIAQSGTAPLPSGEAWMVDRVAFTVPAGCDGIRVRLITTPDYAMGNAQLWYDDVRIAPAG